MRWLIAPAMFAAVLVAGCGFVYPPATCRAPLTQAECDVALVRAQSYIASNPESVNLNGGAPIRLSEIWKACNDAGCMEHLAGFAFVGTTDDAGDPLGRVIVCVDESVCDSSENSFGFP